MVYLWIWSILAMKIEDKVIDFDYKLGRKRVKSHCENGKFYGKIKYFNKILPNI